VQIEWRFRWRIEALDRKRKWSGGNQSEEILTAKGILSPSIMSSEAQMVWNVNSSQKQAEIVEDGELPIGSSKFQELEASLAIIGLIFGARTKIPL
jgi:hypothetical protein